MSEEQSNLEYTRQLLNSIQTDQRVEFFGFTPRGITQTQDFYLKDITDDGRAIISNDAQTNTVGFKNLIPMFNNLRLTDGTNLLNRETPCEVFNKIPNTRILRIKIKGVSSLTALSDMNSIMYEIRKLYTDQTFIVFRGDIIHWSDDSGIFSYVFENVPACMNARMFLLTMRDKFHDSIEVLG